MSTARNKAPTRIAGEVTSDEIVAAAVKRAEGGRLRQQEAKQTKRKKPIHAVDNDPHQANESARQVDALTEVDRETGDVPTQWREPRRLDAPPPRPGYRNRFIRFRQDNEEDTAHFDDMIEEGWRPVKRKSVKKGHELTSNTHGKHGQYYVKRGLILMEIPEKLAIQRERFYNKQLRDMNKGVDRSMFKLNNRIMPLLDPQRQTRVTRQARRGSLEGSVPGDEAEA